MRSVVITFRMSVRSSDSDAECSSSSDEESNRYSPAESDIDNEDDAAETPGVVNPYQDEPLAAEGDEDIWAENDEDGISPDALNARFERRMPLNEW